MSAGPYRSKHTHTHSVHHPKISSYLWLITVKMHVIEIVKFQCSFRTVVLSQRRPQHRLTTYNEVKRSSRVNCNVCLLVLFFWTNSSCLLGRQPPNWKMNNDTAEEYRNVEEKAEKARVSPLTILLPNCTEILLFDFKWATIIWITVHRRKRLALSLTVADCVVKLWASIVLADT